MPYEAELKEALAAAHMAASQIMSLYETFTAIPDAHVGITTQADRESQELILKWLSAHFPGDGFVAEEQTPTLTQLSQLRPPEHKTQRCWIIDPIDGTRGFAQKSNQFSVMIGLVENDQVVVGVVHEPALRRVTFAIRGQGCYRADGEAIPVRCHVTSNSDLASLTLTQSVSKPGVVSKQVKALMPSVVRETHSAGVKLALVARGEADVYVNHYPNFHDWDICAGHLLVEEAGGRVTTLRGVDVRYGAAKADQRLGLVASNGLVHDGILIGLRSAF